MGVRFDSSLSQYFNSTTIHSGNAALTQLAVGAWVKPITTAAAHRYWGIGASASSRYHFLGMNAGGAPTMNSSGTTLRTATGGTVLTTGEWHFLLGRVSATGARSIQALHSTGQISFASDASATTMSSMDRMSIGAGYGAAGAVAGFADAVLAELFWTRINLGGPSSVATTQMEDGTFRKLAFEGPWSVPAIVDHANIAEYHPLFTPLATLGDSYYGARGSAPYTNVNGVSIMREHPPLSGTYVRPTPGAQTRKLLVV